MGMPTSEALTVARSDPRTRTALLLESIALRHQIAVLERSRARRAHFRRWDRLVWILFSRWLSLLKTWSGLNSLANSDGLAYPEGRGEWFPRDSCRAAIQILRGDNSNGGRTRSANR